jgi:hypothetical protein
MSPVPRCSAPARGYDTNSIPNSPIYTSFVRERNDININIPVLNRHGQWISDWMKTKLCHVLQCDVAELVGN